MYRCDTLLVVLGLVMVLVSHVSLCTHMYTFVVSTCMHTEHRDGFKFRDGFGYTYLNLIKFCLILGFHTLGLIGCC